MLTIIVEGAGEEYSLPILIDKGQREKLLSNIADISFYDAHGKPYILQHNPNTPHGIEGYIFRKINSSDCRKFLVLLDSDKTFPPYLDNDEHDLSREFQEMPTRVRQISNDYGVEVNVCWVKWELESWFIGGLRKGTFECEENLGSFTIRYTIPTDSSRNPRDAKNWILKQFSKKREEDYTPSVVECLAMHVNIHEAVNRNSTLREFFDILCQMGIN
jgi:hypothetical protein